MTIRASQVIPVYPLTEDLEPGDLFLVQSPIVDQRRLYKERGFLPFESHVGRIHSTNYATFYRGGYDIEEETLPPRHWQFPDAANWSTAPLAGFPTYTFKIKNSQGLNAAFPISGVPVGLGLMNASSASGSVTLTGAHTYGLPEADLDAGFARWRREHRDLLARHASREGHPQFLRLVTRVYVIKTIDVSLEADGATSGGVTAGVGQSLDLAEANPADIVANYSNALTALNLILDKAGDSLPGGTLKLAAASSRTVALRETFPRPLVVGYLAEEYMILANGELGPAMSTRELVERKLLDPVALADQEIREEQAAAGEIVARIVARMKECPDEACFADFVALAAGVNVVEGGHREDLLATARTDLPKAKLKLQDRLFTFAAGGSLENRCALHELLKAVIDSNP